MEASRQAMIDLVTRVFSGVGKMSASPEALPSPHATANGDQPSSQSTDSVEAAKAAAASGSPLVQMQARAYTQSCGFELR